MNRYIQPPARSEVKWHKGPPPEIGWWPANLIRTPSLLRWWDGKRWSLSVPMRTTTDEIKGLEDCKFFNIPAEHQADIIWSERWWLTPHDKTSTGEK